MTTYFYRFDNEAQYLEVAQVLKVEGDVVEIIAPEPPNADVIGVITTVVDNEPVTLPGYHVNLPYEHEPWWPYQVNPAQPVRIFWGS